MTPPKPNEYPICGSLSSSHIMRENMISSVEIQGNFLTEYEIQALLELGLENYAKSAPFTFSFQGLKRRLGIHQQKLTKALRRLQDKGLIQKITEGYILTKMGGKMLLDYLMTCPGVATMNPLRCASISYELENTRLTMDMFVQQLYGKWFSNYRYVGKAETQDRAIVEFTNDENTAHVCCCLDHQGKLRIGILPADNLASEVIETELQEVIRFIQRTFAIDQPLNLSSGLTTNPLTEVKMADIIKSSPNVKYEFS